MKLNKTFLTAVIFFLLGATAYAQEARVGINTTDPKTTLDVSGKTDTSGNLLTTDMTGLQAPRLTRAELTAKGNALYGTDQKGALIYVTDISAGDTANQRANVDAVGYYYFDGAFWQKIVNGVIAANAWGILGNTSTSPSSSAYGTAVNNNFIGTTDQKDWVIATNNLERMRILSGSTANTGGDVVIGTQTAATVASATSGSTAAQQLAKFTVANGDASINGVTVGLGGGQNSDNTALGNSALWNNTTGYQNTAIGKRTLYSTTTGNKNTAVGNSAGSNQTAGDNNILIGANTDVPSLTGSNQMNIGNIIYGTGMTGTSAAPAGNIGIGTTAPSTKLHIDNGSTAGAIRIVDGTQGANKVLTSDANGVGTWQAAQTPWFYMPSIPISTAATGTGFIKNLYSLYQTQFASPAVKNPSAPASIPNIASATGLYYYISSYDNTVFANVNINDNGVMTYDIISNATPTSYINIVFVVK